MTQFTVRKPKKNPALMLVYYGGRGAGKTTLALKTSVGRTLILAFENVDIIASRHGADDVDIMDGPQDEAGVLALFGALASTPHGYDTIIVDSVTAIDAIAQKSFVDVQAPTAKHNTVRSVQGLGAYGAGKGQMEDLHVRVASSLSRLRDQGARVIVIGHERLYSVKHPGVDEYQKFAVAGFNREVMEHYVTHADAVGRVYNRTSASKSKDGRVNAVEGSRVIDFMPSAHQEAKARLEGMEQSFDWLSPDSVPFAAYLARFQEAPPAPFTSPAEEELIGRAKTALAAGRWAAVEANLIQQRCYDPADVAALRERLVVELGEEGVAIAEPSAL